MDSKGINRTDPQPKLVSGGSSSSASKINTKNEPATRRTDKKSCSNEMNEMEQNIKSCFHDFLYKNMKKHRKVSIKNRFCVMLKLTFFWKLAQFGILDVFKVKNKICSQMVPYSKFSLCQYLSTTTLEVQFLVNVFLKMKPNSKINKSLTIYPNHVILIETRLFIIKVCIYMSIKY